MKTRLLLVFVSIYFVLTTPLNAQSINTIFTKEDKLLYKGYLIEKLHDPESDTWFALLKKDGKVLSKFDKGWSEWQTNFGLSSLFASPEKQLIIEQYTGGAHCCWLYWIYNLVPNFELIYQSTDYNVGYDMHLVDLDKDGVFEFTQRILTFDYFDRLCHAVSPLPHIVFKYDKQKKRYLPANHLFTSYALEGIEKAIEEVKKFNEKTDFRNYDDRYGDHLSGVLRVVLAYVYAGKAQDAWLFYDQQYQMQDKIEMKSKILDKLKADKIYQFIYSQQQ